MPKTDLVSERVAARYATATGERPPLSVKLKNRMEALARGYTRLKRDEIFEVLAYFGWTIEPIVSVIPLGYRGKKIEKTFRTMELAREFYDAVKPRELAALPVSPKAKETYILDMEEPVESVYGFDVAYFLWEGVEGWRVTSPDKRYTYDLLPDADDRVKTRNRINAEPLAKWIKAETDIPDLYAEIAAEKKEQYVRSRDNTGSCPCCMRNIKLEPGMKHPVMVLHGYRRPGSGSTVGRCPGVAYPPYELSSEGTIHLRDDILKPAIKRMKAMIADLDADKVDEVPAYFKSVKRSEVSPDAWERAVKEWRGRIANELSTNEKTLQIAEHLISTWKLQPLPEAGEELAVSRYLSFVVV